MVNLGIEEISYSTDQRELETAVAGMEKGSLGENFKLMLHTLPPSRFMWVGAKDCHGDLVAIVAARLDDTGSWSLQRFLNEHFSRVIEAKDGRSVRPTEDSCIFAKDIKGRCAYLGEGYSTPGWRKKGLATYLIKYMILVTWDEWKPEIIYAWIRRKQMETGSAAIWGFTETYESPLEFASPPLDEDWSDTFFVGLRSIGVHQMIRSLQLLEHKSALSNTKTNSQTPLF